MNPFYTKISIESSDGGWIVKEKKEVTRVFSNWPAVIRYIESRLTSKGYPT